jgi:Cytochrome P450
MCTDNLPKSSTAYIKLYPVIGRLSIVTLEGEQWKRMRKLFNPAFASSYRETMIPAIIEESQVFVRKLESIADTEKVVRMNLWLTVRPHDVTDKVLDDRCHQQGHVQRPIALTTRLSAND